MVDKGRNQEACLQHSPTKLDEPNLTFALPYWEFQMYLFSCCAVKPRKVLWDELIALQTSINGRSVSCICAVVLFTAFHGS